MTEDSIEFFTYMTQSFIDTHKATLLYLTHQMDLPKHHRLEDKPEEDVFIEIRKLKALIHKAERALKDLTDGIPLH